VIRVEKASKAFGGVLAVDNVTLNIEAGSITGLIGPNGAGKTTLFNLIAGHDLPSAGRIWLDDVDVTMLQAHERCRLGLLRTFQIPKEFSTLTVEENLLASAAEQVGETLLGAWLAPRSVRRQEARLRKRAREVMEFLNLADLAGLPAGNLSGGQKKLLELGRTMMLDARVVLLDEIAAGVNRTLLRSIASAILRLNQHCGYTFCMIEHDMDFIQLLCDPVVVLAEGAVLTQGSAREVRADERVIECYLGRGRKDRQTSA